MFKILFIIIFRKIKFLMMIRFNEITSFLVFNTAPIHLGSCNNFSPITYDSVSITTISSIYFLPKRKVAKPVSVYFNIVLPFDIWDSAKWKTSSVIQLHIKIKNDQRYYKYRDDRDHNNMFIPVFFVFEISHKNMEIS